MAASPPLLPKIRRYISTLWDTLRGKTTAPMQGVPRSYARHWRDETTAMGRNYDLEIHEQPIRDQDGKAKELIELHEWCPEVKFSIRTLVQDCLSSADGDDQGIIINEEIREGVEVDAEVFSIGMDLIDRLFHYGELSVILRRMLSWGDCFIELGIDIDQMAVTRLQPLPTWEMFRVETTKGLERFEQRRSWSEEDSIQFIPAKIAHFRYSQNNLYGESLFAASLEDWSRLREATEDLALASREIGVNPTVHEMPAAQSADRSYLNAYRDNHQAQLAEGAIAHYYLMPGERISKVGQTNPDLKPLIESVLMWRSRIVMASGVPTYLFAGIPNIGAKDIAGQPALAYARWINGARAQVTEGIKQIIDTELALKGIPRDRWKYTIGWPKISVSQFDDKNDANVAESRNDDTEADPPATKPATGKKLERLYQEF
jgi:hypothetical protein